MKSRRRLLPIFFLFLVLAGGLYFLSTTGFGKGLTGFFEQMVLPVQKALFRTVTNTGSDTPQSQLRTENTKLLTQLAEFEELKRENSALRDQFKTSKPDPKRLLPAQIIGMNDDVIIIDKGSADNVKAGNILVVGTSAVGRISKVSVHRSVGELLTRQGTSITVKTAKTAALGIGRGQGEGKLILDNVVLADKLEKNDLVVTKGDTDENGAGYPPDLVLGKIISVNKKTSELFQAAEVEPLLNYAKMEVVFVLTEK